MKAGTVLITGAHGFLGRHAALEFKKEGCRVTGMGHGSWGAAEHALWGIDRYIETDITLPALEGLGKEKFDVIVHCAGSGSVRYSLAHPFEDFSRTVGTTAAVLEYMRLCQGAATLIYPSSAAVYGARADSPIMEDAPTDPISPYGCHKHMVEEMCKSFSKNFGLRTLIIRFFSLYGRGLRKQLLWDACKKFSSGNGEAVFFGDGEETRDWLHINDAARLIAAMTEYGGSFSIINGGSGLRVTNREVLELLASEFGRGHTVRFNGKIPDGDPRFYLADLSGSAGCGWRPLAPLKDGVRDYVNWFREADAS